MTLQSESDIEKELISRKKGEELAEASRDLDDPFDDIPPSLLSAEHVRRYVEKTGMISPFYIGGGRRSRLKRASYEGRIGEKAFRFDEHGNGLLAVSLADGSLIVRANSIVFVESDLDFSPAPLRCSALQSTDTSRS